MVCSLSGRRKSANQCVAANTAEGVHAAHPELKRDCIFETLTGIVSAVMVALERCRRSWRQTSLGAVWCSPAAARCCMAYDRLLMEETGIPVM